MSLFAGNNGSEFFYDVNGQRTQQIIFEGLTNVTKKVYATPAYEMKETLINPAETNRALWQWEVDFVRIYVDTPAGKIGIYQETPISSSTNNLTTVSRSYIHKDHLGSVIAVSDDSTNITFYSYDAWGNRRNASDWSSMSADLRRSTSRPSTLSTDRGFTGHEQLDHLGLVHMNGRIYDPVIGKMISPDPNIQSPDNLQSFNRYAFVWNNPLSFIAPEGFLGVVPGSASRAEPIRALPVAEQDRLSTGPAGSSAAIEKHKNSDYDEDDPYGAEDEYDLRVRAVEGASGREVSALKEAGTSGGDLNNYGTGTGSSAQLAQVNTSATRASADNAGLGVEAGALVQGMAESSGSVAEAAEGGTGEDNEKNANGAESDAAKQAQNERIQKAIDRLRGLEWGKSAEGVVIIDRLEKMRKMDKISFVDKIENKEGKAAQGFYDGKTGQIQIIESLNQLQLAMNLAHEGRHAVDYNVLGAAGWEMMGLFQRERRAHDASDAIYSEAYYKPITGEDYHTSDEDIRKRYGLNQ